MQSVWTQYWKSGHAESLPKDQAAGRLMELDSVWRKFLSEIPDGARLLDLATGGGDIIRKAITLGRHFNFTGVDIADLSTVRSALQNSGIVLVGNTDLSSLPFSDAAFDGVTSQFGLEYADVAAATREAIRVLAPGGRGQFVLHHVDSAITQNDSKSLAAYHSVFADSNAFQLGRKIFELHQCDSPHAAILKAQTDFQSAVGTLQSRLRSEPAFGQAHKVVAFLAGMPRSPGFHPATEVLRKIEDAEKQIQAVNLRKLAQIEAALDGNGIDNIAELLAGAGAIVDTPLELKSPEGELIAWSLSFYK